MPNYKQQTVRWCISGGALWPDMGDQEKSSSYGRWPGECHLSPW